VDPTPPKHEETIVPIRPARAGGGRIAVPGDAAPARFAGARVGTWLTAAGVAILVAGAAVAFVWLPSHVAEEKVAREKAAATPAVAAPVAAAVEPLSPEEAARLKDQAEKLLAGLLQQQKRLTAQNVESWGGDAWHRYESTQRAGEDAFLASDFRAAVKDYADATALGDDLLARAVQTVDGALAAAAAAFGAGNVELALRQYDIVLGIDPEHAGAKAGRARAERLPEVLAAMSQADAERARGDLKQALGTYRDALKIDAGWDPARTAVAEITRQLRDDEFERHMSGGASALAAQKFADAEQQFRAALAVRSDAREAQEGLAQAQEGTKTSKLALTEARALAFEKRELWDEAVALYRQVLVTDATLLFAQTGLARSTSRAGLDAKLSNLIQNPTLLFGDQTLAAARELIGIAGEVDDKGPRLERQIEDLGHLVGLATTPIRVQLTSDLLTDVTLYRVGALGAFSSKEVDLRPGTYTAIGSRDGFRDVRRTFTIVPGREPPLVSVVCKEPI
jgi:eukaryotic-like serine/threonine-protein kinase